MVPKLEVRNEKLDAAGTGELPVPWHPFLFPLPN